MVGGNDEVLLTLSQVKEWEEEGRKIDNQITELQSKRDEISRKLEAVRMLFPKPKPVDLNIEVKPEDLAPKETMVDATIRILREAKAPLDNSEIKDKLSEDDAFREKLSSSPNYFYTMMKRLLDRKDDTRVVKAGNGYVMANSIWN